MIATLLLIVFAIALGIITMMLGGSYLEDSASLEVLEGCSYVPLDGTSFSLDVKAISDDKIITQSAQCTLSSPIPGANQVAIG